MSSSITISAAKHNEAIEAVERWKRKYQGMQEAGEARAGLVIGGATVLGTEALVGYMRGRYGEKKMGPINAEIAGGLACELLALSGLAGKWSESVALVGHATIGFALGLEAMRIGEQHKIQGGNAKSKETVDAVGEEVQGKTTSPRPIQRRREVLPEKRQRVDIASRQSRMADDVEVPQPEEKTGT